MTARARRWVSAMVCTLAVPAGLSAGGRRHGSGHDFRSGTDGSAVYAADVDQGNMVDGNITDQVGWLQLNLVPTNAQAYVDDALVGRLEEMTVPGRVSLGAGPHHIAIRASGFVPLAFDVRIEPQRTITYEGRLAPIR